MNPGHLKGYHGVAGIVFALMGSDITMRREGERR